MKIVVIGGTGLIGTKVVDWLSEQGHDVTPAAPETGVNTITGAGLAEAVDGAAAVVDVSNAPSYDGNAPMEFFPVSTGNLLEAETSAGVGHHVVLSIVGAEDLTATTYFRAKVAQEELVARSSVPYSIVRATQFFEFIGVIAGMATVGDGVRVPPVLLQPAAAAEIAAAVGRVAIGPPSHGAVEVAGPEQFRLDELIRRQLEVDDDPRRVVADPRARYFGAVLAERTLVPDDGARFTSTTFVDWLGRQPETPNLE
jgi:uncharacterized protein YbjT (DUF2867 family)